MSYYESYKCETKFNLDNVVFTAQQFEKAVTTLPPKSAILWDEAVFGAMATEWSTIVNRTITKLMVTIRKKQLFINVIVPWIYMLQPYLAVGRTRALIHTVTPDGIQRGHFRFYDYVGKQQLYFKNKKFYTYYGVKEVFKGTFAKSDNLFYDEDEYDKKKDVAIESILSQDKKSLRDAKWKAQRDRVIAKLLNHESAFDVATLTEMSEKQVHLIRREHSVNNLLQIK